MSRKDVGDLFSSRTTIFVLQIVYLAAAFTLAGLYLTDVLDVRHSVGDMPVPVLWFGALGGILISFTGVISPRGTWKRDYVYWHWARPLMGATAAIIAVLIVQAGIVVVTGTDTSKSAVLYYLVAFLVGYREETFRELIKRLGDVILSPGGSVAPTITTLAPTHGIGGTPITIAGADLKETRSVSFGGIDANPVDVKSDVLVTTQAPAHAPGAVQVLIETKTGTSVADFTYDGAPVP